jgi:hypothetical protein
VCNHTSFSLSQSFPFLTVLTETNHVATLQAAADTGYLAVQPDWLKDQWDLLSAQPWFTGFQSRDEAKQALASGPPGSFVTRVRCPPQAALPNS